ncbi:MAG TPA: hypothetical protein GX391_05135 [Firmicutes bacterium]|jgi:flagellar basal-body rod modification protein FlgD|nr:hypothetical protein [Bacillota bacterium]HOQ23573.1 flagellar hook capping FlgD N-terminal domain-containing protein [Bacillota bacterium]HPT67254.1 flagellar hook capping FlgD N-terminal domain-containing protein [Bacillota bacterium]
MAVSSTTGVSTISSSTITQSSNSQLGKDEFLKLLVTQLQYQDPLNPLSDTDFIAQMAQFSALEQMYNVYRVGELQQATNLIGRHVKAEVYTIPGQPEWVYGKVQGVRTFGGTTYLILDGGREVKAEDVVTALDEAGLIQELEGMIGKIAAVRVYDATGETVSLRGVLVADYALEKGTPYLISADGERIALKDVWMVGEA